MRDTNTFFRPSIAAMEGYIPGEQPRTGQFIKLNSNENPYPPPASVLEKLRQACNGDLRFYPDPNATKLRQLLSDTFGPAPEQFMVGNGSDELLTIIIRSFVGEGDKIAYPYPTYGYYKPLIEIQGAQGVAVDFPADFSLPDGLKNTGARLTFLVNPNAPSGTLLPIDQVAELAAQIDGILVVDEAYVDFSEGGSIDLIAEHANTIVVRTMSKSFSLAGMRIGFACARPELIAGMWKVKDHYNLNRLSLVAAEAALEEIGAMRQNAARIGHTRAHLTQGLRQLGFFVWDSAANFVLARSNSLPANRLYQELKERRILVRHFDQPRLHDCLRISVGTDGEMEALLDQLQDILTAK